MEENKDLISSLPDQILAYILSFSSTRTAVQTCILAKRWRNIWTSVPVLYFFLDEFWKRNEKDHGDEQKCRIAEDQFVRFVDGVLENRGASQVHRVLYVYNYDSEVLYPVNHKLSLDWLDRVALLMPWEIAIYIARNQALDPPDSVFTCASLQKLVLSLFSEPETIIEPKSIKLPSLKILELNCVTISDNFTRKLFLGCPSLEILDLSHCELHLSDISSNVLKKLNLDVCRLHQPLQISCPALVTFYFKNYYPIESISLRNMASLVHADIRLYGSHGNVDVPTLNLLSGLSNASSIVLRVPCHQLKEQLDKDIPNCRTFNNLKTLELGSWDMIDNFALVACFLRNSPNLQKLTLWLEKNQGGAHKDPREEAVGDVPFQLEYLDTVEIHCSWGREFAIKLVKILDRYIKLIGNIIILV